ncbi:BEL1-like homeodomain protein 11 [Apium graveolens]|uniref:BEL1-like homeodomain protein 11 n=1 Tax=Apium graveolens TaxID=4045 RepID=UPI003D79BCE7
MDRQDSPPTSNTLHQFLNPDSISNQTQTENQHLDAFGADLIGNAYHHSMRPLPNIQTLGKRMSRSVDLLQVPPLANESEINYTRQLPNLFDQTPNESSAHTQKLSLSLGSLMLLPPAQYRQRPSTSDIMSPTYSCNPAMDHGSNVYSISDSSFASSLPSHHQISSNFYGTESYMIAVGESKYLKPTQSLLEEAISVGGKLVQVSNEEYIKKLSPTDKKGSLGVSSELRSDLLNNVLSSQKPQLEAKLSKLISLLKEVESTFEQYYHHMEEVVSSFEVIAGLGSGESYTALALQAMSRHFCSLKDAIIYQICVIRRKHMPKLNMGLSQLSLNDQENRVSLQQLGMIQSRRQTWRPIRGLPENSVTILRSWLFEHFLHPYPNDSEKLVLASHTGLSKNQISNWFINARVRLWKPMIEEMYKEEFEDDPINPVQENNSSSNEKGTDDVEESSI